MKKSITIGSHVEFDTEHGPQRGTVADIKPHIGNGQQIASIKVPGTQSNMSWTMPVNELQLIKAAA